MTPARVAALTVALVLIGSRAGACPCQGSSGPGGSVTTQSERFGASLTETARWVHGAWRPRGEYASLAEGDRQSALDLTALAGYRPIPVVEIGAEAAFGHESASSTYVSSARTGFGDTVLRVRWDAIDEPMPFTPSKAPWPAVSFVAAVRAPTAARGATSATFSGTTGSVGASASSEGLGAWEGSAAAVFMRSVGNDWMLSAVGEAAYRLPDSWTGIPRHLGPRIFAQLGARYSPTNVVAFGVLTDLGWEGAVTYEGETAPTDSSQRLWTISGYFLLKPPGTGFRWGLLARTAPTVSSVGKNAVATTSAAVSVGYAF
jgi:hypothetical protein